MSTDQTPAQRMASMQNALEQNTGSVHVVLSADIRWLLDRCRKLEKAAEAMVRYRNLVDYIGGDNAEQCANEQAALDTTLKEANYDV